MVVDHLQVKPQTLSNLLYAFAILDCHPGSVFLTSLSVAVERQVCRHRDNSAAGYYLRLACMHDYLSNSGDDNIALAQVQMFKPQELAASLWGFAKLKHHPGTSLLSIGLTETRRCD